jgi:hypothetical protein
MADIAKKLTYNIFFQGKTHFVIKLIQNSDKMFQHPPEKIIYCYGVYQDAFKVLEDSHPNIIMHEGLPAESFIDQELDTAKYNLLILDDLLEEFSRSRDISILFTRGMHHRKISLFVLYQNLFHQSPHMRTISLNLSYFVLMKTFRDKQQIGVLAKQMFGNSAKAMLEAYENATNSESKPKYLVVSNHPDLNEEDRLATSIFPDEILTLYISK